jgi:energy-coupling factor transporter ATP-binding protein EcfA2
MAEQPRIASVRLVGVFGHQQLPADFKPGLNLVHGKNGSGKTTLLHVIANLLECDLFRFCYIRFERLFVRLQNDVEIILEQRRVEPPTRVRVFLRGVDLGEIVPTGAPVPDSISTAFAELFPSRPVYLPAFRSILEAANDRERYVAYRESETASREFQEIMDNEERYVKDRRQRAAGRIAENPRATASKTILSRRWFGSFVPIVR